MEWATGCQSSIILYAYSLLSALLLQVEWSVQQVLRIFTTLEILTFTTTILHHEASKWKTQGMCLTNPVQTSNVTRLSWSSTFERRKVELMPWYTMKMHNWPLTFKRKGLTLSIAACIYSRSHMHFWCIFYYYLIFSEVGVYMETMLGSGFCRVPKELGAGSWSAWSWRCKNIHCKFIVTRSFTWSLLLQKHKA